MVHHPNEIAQTQARHNTRLANFWMHGYFLQIDAGRMGKSMGNFLRLETLIDEGYEPLVWRFFCLGAHYRAKLNFTWEGLAGAATALAAWACCSSYIDWKFSSAKCTGGKPAR